MSRFQLSIKVDDVDASVEFCTRLFGVGPAKHRPGYATFDVDELRAALAELLVVESSRHPGRIHDEIAAVRPTAVQTASC